MRTLNDIFRRSCQWRGGDAMFVDEQDQISGDDAFVAAARMGACFRSLGAGPGAVVAFLSTCSARHAVSWFGALQAGQVACNLHMRETPQRLGETLRWLDARVLVHDESQTELARSAVAAAGIACALVSLGAAGWAEALAGAGAPRDAAHVAQPSDVAAIILSSGSTGRPKGVVHTQASLLEACKGGQYALSVPTRSDTGLLYMQPSFAGWSIIALPLVAAGCCCIRASALSTTESTAPTRTSTWCTGPVAMPFITTRT